MTSSDPGLDPGRVFAHRSPLVPAAALEVRPSPKHRGEAPGAGRTRLRLLSYNIQTGIVTSRYRHYVTQSWKHLLPYRRRMENLDRIAGIISGYDLVGLQEADAGSLRSGYINQVGYLAQNGGFPFWYHQTNRRLGKIAQHSLGLVSRVPLDGVTRYRLPGAIPGRGALIARLGSGPQPLFLIILHLALGKRGRLRQISAISELIREHAHVILMGDLNCRSESQEMDLLLKETGLRQPIHGLLTFPSWRPQKSIDHILVSPSLKVEEAAVLNFRCSDHLPVSAVISVPGNTGLSLLPGAWGAATRQTADARPPRPRPGAWGAESDARGPGI